MQIHRVSLGLFLIFGAAQASFGCSGGSLGEPCSFGDQEGTIVASQGECLLDDAFCVERPDGTWCTGATAPSCPDDALELSTDEPCPDGYFCWQPGFALQCAKPE